METQISEEVQQETPDTSNIEIPVEPEIHRNKFSRVESDEIDISTLERDPRLRRPIFEYSNNLQDEIRRAYIKFGLYQPKPPTIQTFKLTNKRHFVTAWYKLFPEWLKYSPVKDCAYCLPCYLFCIPSGHSGSTYFTIDGFKSWKKVNDGKNCAFLGHVGKNSPHGLATQRCHDLAIPTQHLVRVIEKQTLQQAMNNRLRLSSSIDVIRWLTFQRCTFRDSNEGLNSKNRGNFLEMLKLLATYNEEVKNVVL